MTLVPGRLLQWWDQRSSREKRMLALMIALAGGLVVWAAVIRPVSIWREEAASRRERAAAELVEVATAVRVLPQPSSPADGRLADAGGIEPILRRTAEAAGLQITTGMASSGHLGFRVSRAASPAVFGWLAMLKTDHGLDPFSLSVVENTDATLEVEGAF